MEKTNCAELPIIIKALAMEASRNEQNGEDTHRNWSELSVGERLSWIETENKKMVYAFSQ